MDLRSELAWEHAALAKADRDLREGQVRVDRQAALVSELKARGQDARQSERLLRLLRETLFEWRRHRELILGRIAHLEAALPASVPAAGGGG